MLNIVQNLLCSIMPTALAARCQARIALSMGEYGIAADHYATAARRLGNLVLSPYFAQPLLPCVLKACALSARRVAGEEGQQVRSRAAMMNLSYDTPLHVLVGISTFDRLEGRHPRLTTDERLLLVLHNMPESIGLLQDLGIVQMLHYSRARYDPGVRGLYVIRSLAYSAASGNIFAMRDLGQLAIRSERAHRALARLAAAGVPPGACLQMSEVRSERHSIFLNMQRIGRERLEDEIRSIIIMRF